MHIGYTVAMKRGELKDKIIGLLSERGPMTTAQIAAELGVGSNDVTGAMKAMLLEGRVRVLKRDRKMANTWVAVPRW